MTTASFTTKAAMMEWQYKQILGELALLQGHASDLTCPCTWADLGEFCLSKHSLVISMLAAETAAMEPRQERQALLWDLQEEANDLHQETRAGTCGQGEPRSLPEIVDWARQWRKRIEPWYYACNGARPRPRALKAAQDKRPAPRVRISGSCDAGTCSFSVTAARATKVKTGGLEDLPQAIEEARRRLQEQATGSRTTFAFGPVSGTRYRFEWRVVPVQDLIASHDPFTFQPNPDYPPALQPRMRGRAATRRGVR